MRAIFIMSDRSDVLFRRVLVVSGFLVYVLCYVRGSLVEPGLVDVLLGIGIAAIVVKFCIVDYRMRDRTLVRSYHWLIFFMWPLGLPVYLLCSRGIWKGIVAILLVLAGVCIASVMGYGIGYLVWSVAG